MKIVQKAVAFIIVSMSLGGASQLCSSEAQTERAIQSTPHLTVIKVRAKGCEVPNSSSYRSSTSSTTFSDDLEITRNIDVLKKASDNGDRNASGRLSNYYATIDIQEAYHYYERGCQQYIDSITESELETQEQWAEKDGEIAFVLATGYTHAQQRKDLQKASRLYLIAAKLGNGDALWHFANEYLSADTISESKSLTALAYLKACAPRGFPEAYVKIAYMYEKGIGVTKSEEIAKKYMAEAEQQLGQEAAAKYLEQLQQAEAAKQRRRNEDEAAAKELKQLEQEKIEREEHSINCSNQRCLFEGHEWFFKGCKPCSCPKQITAGQTVYYCDTCHQAFHLDCIANWRKQWAITATEGCPNPKCSNQNKSLLAYATF